MEDPSIRSRQADPMIELDAIFGAVNTETFIHDFVTTYGTDTPADRKTLRYILGEIGTTRRGEAIFVKRADYLDFLKAFFPIIHQNTGVKPREGYKPSELQEVFVSPWWKGNMGGAAFEKLLRENQGVAYVRRSESDRSAFVIGFDKGEGAELYKYTQTGHRITTLDTKGLPVSFRLVTELYSAFTTAREGVEFAGRRRYMYDHRWARPRWAGSEIASDPVPDLAFEAHREISRNVAKEECDWSRWI